MNKLHLGCGNIVLSGWINIDFESPNADIKHDLNNPLPFKDGSAEFIFAEHFIEHISYENACNLFRECRRVLAPGGVLRLSTPDLMYLVKVYISGEITEWGELWQPKDPCELLNQAFRYWGHQYVYDFESLRNALCSAGFSSISRVKWRQSKHAELKNLESRPFHGEIIIESSDANDVKDEYLLSDYEALKQIAFALNIRIEKSLKSLVYSAKSTQIEIEELKKNISYIADLRLHILNQDSELSNLNQVIVGLQSQIANLKIEGKK